MEIRLLYLQGTYYLMLTRAKAIAKDLWDALEKYLLEDAATNKKFLATKILNYILIDSRSIIEQFNENTYSLSRCIFRGYSNLILCVHM